MRGGGGLVGGVEPGQYDITVGCWEGAGGWGWKEGKGREGKEKEKSPSRWIDERSGWAAGHLFLDTEAEDS